MVEVPGSNPGVPTRLADPNEFVLAFAANPVTVPVPAFASRQAFRAGLDDTKLWARSIATVLERHAWAGSRDRTTAGVGATYPTFLHGDLAIKLFGGHSSWRASFRAERAALAAVAGVPGVAAPELLAAG